MRATMQDTPLQTRRILDYAASFHAATKVLTAAPATPAGLRRADYATIGGNAARLAHALRGLGVGAGDRVATFMWNNQEHLEAYYAVPCMGAVVHPLNPRLPAEQIIHIANHALDRALIVDASLLPALLPLLPHLGTVEHVIVNGADTDAELDLDGTAATGHHYAQLLAAHSDTYPWPALDERQAAAMCYTSGTTGDPKGVVYSHRSIYLHALGSSLPDVFGLSAADRVLAIVPQFHVLAWGLPYSALLIGASLALPDCHLSPEPLTAFIAAARPTKAAGVPTVWQNLLRHLDTHPDADISSLREGIVGGSACPPAIIQAYQDRHGISLLHAWGMTETSPLGSLARPSAQATPEQAWRQRLTQGRFPATVEPRLVGLDGAVLPHDGRTTGELEVRGPWITGAYHTNPAYDPVGENENGNGGDSKFHDGWLRTGDIGSITPDGYLTITDRAKDVIKSGGEWISSIELENQLMAHPAVVEAAVIAVPDQTWGERPLAAVVPTATPATPATPATLRAYLAERVPKWQLPEHWAIISTLPKTSVGKYDKKALRQLYANGELPTETIH
jgi:fatty-acyl-CoA synthase